MTKRKKKPGNGNGNGNNSSANKRPRNDNNGGGLMAGNPHGYIDKTTGQHGAFPGLHQNDQAFLGPAHDGLSYLRMVRSEAALVPSLLLSASIPRPEPPKPAPLRPRMTIVEATNDTLDYDEPPSYPAAEPELSYDEPPVAPATDGLSYDKPAPVEEYYEEEEEAYEDGEGTPEDQDYYFSESTYVSLHRAPAPPPPPPHHHALLDRFRALRLALHLSPPTPLDPAPKFPRIFSYAWVNETSPSPGMLWSMDQQRVVRMIRGLGHQIGTGTRTVRRGLERRVGQWAWGLLVRVDDTMTGDEVGTVREMAKISLGILKKLLETKDKEDLEAAVKDMEVLEEKEGAEDNPKDDDEEMVDSAVPVSETAAPPTTATADAPVPDGHEDPEVDWNYTIATLDMIISIVGDFFGQRDLLEERSLLANK